MSVKVEKGWITLGGELEWNYQRGAAKNTVSRLNGVIGLSNNITLNPQTTMGLKKGDIEHALSRNWSLNDRDIRIKILISTVSLNGTVDSSYQKDEAGRIAWNSPGVLTVPMDPLSVKFLILPVNDKPDMV